MCIHQWKGQHVLIGLPSTLPFLSLLSHSHFLYWSPTTAYSFISFASSGLAVHLSSHFDFALNIYSSNYSPVHSGPSFALICHSLSSPLLISTDHEHWCLMRNSSVRQWSPRVFSSLHLHNPTAKLCALRSNMGNPGAAWMKSVSTLCLAAPRAQTTDSLKCIWQVFFILTFINRVTSDVKLHFLWCLKAGSKGTKEKIGVLEAWSHPPMEVFAGSRKCGLPLDELRDQQRTTWGPSSQKHLHTNILSCCVLFPHLHRMHVWIWMVHNNLRWYI